MVILPNNKMFEKTYKGGIMFKRLGYDKNVILEFNNKRNCGLWLLIIGLVITISTFFGGEFLLNPFLFLIGYYIGFYIANINKTIREKLSQGNISDFQEKIIFLGILILFIFMFFLGGSFIPFWNWRMIWLGVMLATGIHFLIYYFVHGKAMIALGILCSLVGILGYIFSTIPFFYFGYADGFLKLMFGIYMLFFSKPSKARLRKG